MALMWGAKRNNISSLTGPLVGKCLISMPGMSDARFERSVIYVCSHTERDGTVGLVINKLAAKIGFKEVLSQLNLSPGNPDFYPEVLFGGPVDVIRGFVLHSNEYHRTETVPVNEDLSLTATMDILADMATGNGPVQRLLTLGHSAWRPGQLEAEIAGNCWLVVEANDDLLFKVPTDERWHHALNCLGVDPSLLSFEQGSV